ncbi:MAG: phosphate ABC transporter ATP-binding protein [Methanosarcinales archaeon]|nr:phosphate ABC transporter ATP-binding protein [Methanosarcinales archaeon]
MELHDVGLSRGGQRILAQVNLKVKRGEIVAIIGPTGSGKTSMLRIADLLDQPDKGRVIYDQLDVSRDQRARLAARRRMSMVFQRPAMFNSSVGYNVAYGLKLRGARGADLEERVDEALRSVGLSGYQRRSISGLSGGEVQRVALARSLAVRPELLILDEATANLDPSTVSAIEGLIQASRERGATVLMATHDLLQSRRLADRVAVMMAGTLVQVGRPDEVFSQTACQPVASFVQGEEFMRLVGDRA